MSNTIKTYYAIIEPKTMVIDIYKDISEVITITGLSRYKLKLLLSKGYFKHNNLIVSECNLHTSQRGGDRGRTISM